MAVDGGVGIDRPITLNFNEAKEYVNMAIYESIVRKGENLAEFMAEMDGYLNDIYANDK